MLISGSQSVPLFILGDPIPPVPVHHRHTTYSGTEVTRLCEDHGIDLSHKDEVKAGLEDAAAIWHWYASGRDSTTRSSDAAIELRKLAKRAHTLRDTIDGLPDGARTALITSLLAAEATVLVGDNAAPDTPSLVIRVPGEDEDDLVSLELSALSAILVGLADLAHQADARLQPQRRGQRRDHALRMWMTNVAMLWDSVSDDPFSRDVEAGTPVTPAARFCVAAFNTVDPKTPTSRVLNEMKQLIKKRRARTGRINDKT